MSIKKILGLCQQHGFLKLENSMLAQLNSVKVLPTGMLLQENLKTEWFNSVVINKDTTILFSQNNFHDTLEYAKQLCSGILPFGIAEIIEETNSSPNNDEQNMEEMWDFKRNFKVQDNFILKCNVYVSPKQSTPFFHQFQRQRRMWWRKFSPNPGRYFFSDIQNGDNNNQTIDILANYEWGPQILEKLSLKSTEDPLFEFKDGKNKQFADCVSSEILFSSMFLNTLCDAYDEPLLLEKPRPLLHFHRKLAPYKLSFAIDASKSSTAMELKDLALYLCRQLRDNHVSTLFLPSCSRLALDTQWRQYDQMGIPYNIHLSEGTLKDGIAALRSRDTTLKEQIHVSDIVSYVEKLFKNY